MAAIEVYGPPHCEGMQCERPHDGECACPCKGCDFARVIEQPDPPHRRTTGERCECTGCAEWRHARR